MSLATLTAAAIFVSLIAYALSGGADFGGGVWELFASGPRKQAQRQLIAHALGPIWEANHVWLILIVVLLFVGFPSAFALLSVRLHVPLTLMLLGVVMRGSAFVFRAYDPQPARASAGWSRVFSLACALTPLALGATLGAAAAGNLESADFVSAWWAPFPLLVGALVLSLFMLTAAVYLLLETSDPALQGDFRLRALATALSTGVLAWVTLLLSRSEAPHLYETLLGSLRALPLQALCTATGLALGAALWMRRYALSRGLVIALVTLVVSGLGIAQYPYLIYPTYPIAKAAAPPEVLRPLLVLLLAGSLVLGPSLFYLYRVFKGQRAAGAGSA